ncbi:MAG: Serine/threonine-protein kinase PknD [Phycisphaerae bacterium]|nr:Serine/threonine-protein kinase PknD [Phycisphaerae bacterium]
MSKTPTASVPDGKHAAPAPAATGGSQIGLKSGTRLGKYEIIGRLGIGGQAVVYKGYDPLLDRFVAIKQISSHLATDDKFMDRFRKEAQILARLGTDAIHVVQIYDLVEEERGLFIVMEFVEGQTLDMLIEKQNGPMDVQLALSILWHVAVGLKAVHAKGIIHRDIKPANIIVDTDRRCRITDFGVAARTGGKTSMTLGTTKYMAPELFTGEEVDGRVDIYSLGFIMYEMLVGKARFNDIFRDVVRDEKIESLRWMKWHSNREIMAPLLNNVNPQVPEILAKIVAKMCAKNPEQRFESADHLLEILRRHFTQAGVKQQQAVQRSKKVAAAKAAEMAIRKPEPIPDREAVLAPVVKPEPVVLKADGTPKTTRLPRRKMTRQQRLIVLGTLVAIMAAGVIVFYLMQNAKKARYLADAKNAYNAASAYWSLAGADSPEQGDQTAADYMEAVTKWKLAQLARARAMLEEVKAKYPGTIYADKYVDARMQMIDARTALVNRDWVKAEKLGKEMEARVKQAKVDATIIALDENEVRKFNTERDVDRRYYVVVDEARQLMTDGVATRDPDKFRQARSKLEEALEIKKDALAEVTNLERMLAESQVQYKYLYELEQGDQADNDRDDLAAARTHYVNAQKIKDTPELKARMTGLNRREEYARLILQGKEAENAQKDADAADIYTQVLKVFPDGELTDSIKDKLQKATGRSPDELPERIKKLRARDLYRKAVLAKAGNDTATALKLIADAKKLDPSMGMLDILEREINGNLKYDDAIKSAEATMAKGQWDDAITQFRTARRMVPASNNARQEKDHIDQQIRTCEFRRHRDAGDRAWRTKDLNTAEQELRQALNYTSDTNDQTRINRTLDQIKTQRNYLDLMKQGDDLLAQKDFNEAIKKWTQAGVVFGSQNTEIKERINEAYYQDYLGRAKDAIDAKAWDMAKAWLNKAGDKKNTPEVNSLLDFVLEQLGKQGKTSG